MKTFSCKIWCAVLSLCCLAACQQEEMEQYVLQQGGDASIVGAANSRSVTFTVTTTAAGELMTKLAEQAVAAGYEKEDVTELTIVGPVDREDLRALRPFEKMTKLDMTEMTVIDEWGYQSTYFPDRALDSLASPAHVFLPTSIDRMEYNSLAHANIVAVDMPDNVTSMNSYVFEGSKKLQTVKLSNALTEILWGTFEDCKSLTSVDLPDSLLTIHASAFRNCGFTSFEIPETVEFINDNAFSLCEHLETINWPSKVTEIPYYCFYGCKKLQFQIPDWITNIGSAAFNGCSSMKDIIIPASVTSIGDEAFRKCSSMKDIIIPASVTSIGGWAFAETSITSMDIPASVTTLGIGLFYECDELQTVTGIENWTKISDHMFDGCEKLDISIPQSVDTIGNVAFSGCKQLKSALPPNLKYIGSHGFYSCESLPNPVFGEVLEEVGDWSFAYSSVKELTFPASLKSIGSEAFCNTPLEKVVLQEGVEKLGTYAFESTKIGEITIPSTVTSVGYLLVGNCSELKVIYWNTTADIPELFYSWNNYGTLIYAPVGINSHENNKNLILGSDESGYTTEKVELVYNKDFFCPKPFTAKEVVFRRHYGTWNYPDRVEGWRTLSLPFTVSKIVAKGNDNYPEDRTLLPFGTEEMGDAKPFWLRTLQGDGFERKTTIEAGTPYIIAFPYNPNYYLPEYNIDATVEFWGENAYLSNEKKVIEGNAYSMHPTYEKLTKSMDIYNIDYNSYSDQMNDIYYYGGSVFRSSIRDTEPYEAYLMSNDASTRSYIPIGKGAATRGVKQLGNVPMEEDMDF